MDKENKIAVALADAPPGGVQTAILGVPKGAWDYMSDGKTHTFDLRQVGIPVQIVIFGGNDRATVMETMEAASLMLSGQPLENKPGAEDRNLGIAEPKAN